MSKRAQIGEMTTAVYFRRMVGGMDADANWVPEEKKIFVGDDGTEIPVMGKWVNAHGLEVFTAMQLEIKEPVTFTTRYSPALCDNTLIAYRKGDPDAYEVISYDNVENRNMWLEIKLQRRKTAR